MQRQINNNIHLWQTVSPFASVGYFAAIKRTASDFDNANQRVKKNKKT